MFTHTIQTIGSIHTFTKTAFQTIHTLPVNTQAFDPNHTGHTHDPRVVSQKLIILQMITRNSTHVMLDLPSSHKQYGTIYVYNCRSRMSSLCAFEKVGIGMK